MKGAIVIAQTGFEADAILRLKQAGFRITLPRVQVLRALSLAEKPLTAYGIHQEIVANGASVDVVSVYRMLETLTKLNLIHYIGLAGGYIACRLDDTHEDDAEHVVCSRCGKVTELTMPSQIMDVTRGQLETLGFFAEQTRVEILAVCPECAVQL